MSCQRLIIDSHSEYEKFEKSACLVFFLMLVVLFLCCPSFELFFACRGVNQLAHSVFVGRYHRRRSIRICRSNFYFFCNNFSHFDIQQPAHTTSDTQPSNTSKKNGSPHSSTIHKILHTSCRTSINNTSIVHIRTTNLTLPQ